MEDFENENLTEEDFLEQLLDKANSGRHREFEFIRCIDELRAAKYIKKCLKKVIGMFRHWAKTAFKLYLYSIDDLESDVAQLIDHRIFRDAERFYKEELDLMEYMIEEYYTYIINGHIIDTILDNYRPDEDLIDYLDDNNWNNPGDE